MRLFNCLVFALFALLATGCAPSRFPTEPFPYVPYSPPPQIIETAPRIEKPLIVLDPGHGGEDFGTTSTKPPKYHEKNLNLTTSHMLRNILKEQGFEVLMTRKDDVFVTLSGRAEFANQRKPLLFVSVHYNSAPSEKAEGIEVFYYNTDKDKSRSEASKLLASSILDRVITNTKAKSRGVKHGNLAVIRETTMPAVLIEGGFLTNEGETQKLKDPSYIKSLAWGIAQGIQDYLKLQNEVR